MYKNKKLPKCLFSLLSVLVLLSLCACKTVVSQSSKSQQNISPLTEIEFKKRFYDVGGQRLAYQDSGGLGEVVLFLHPFSSTDKTWKYQLSALSQVGYRVVAPAQRGVGPTENFTLPEVEFTEDILRLLDYLGLKKVHLVGSAAGGIYGLRFSINYPERVISLTLSNSVAGVNASEFASLRKNIMPPSDFPVEFKALGASYRYANPNGVNEWLALQSNSLSAKLAVLSDSNKKALFASMINSLADIEEIKTLKVPVQLIYGGADLIVPASFARKIEKRFAQAKMIVLPEVGHYAHWENPEKFNEVLINFYSSIKNNKH
jgi:pimeloyl-ACP methyl ester carboxylesterase